jgi:hypothetical protein
MITNEDLVELYAAASAIEAERLVLLLNEDGVEALARETTASSFPTSGMHLIMVRTSDREKAHATIALARSEGAVTDRGEWL